MVFSKGVTLMGTLSEADTWPGDASLDALLASLGTSRAGLASGEAALRLASGGPNALPRAVPTPLWRIVGRQLANPLVLILSAAAAVSLAFGDAHDAAFIAVAIAIDAAIGAWQEQQAEYTSRAMEKLLKRLGWTVADVDLFEINEAFSVVPMAAMRDLQIPHEKLNIHGGAVCLGHPIGASGARIIATLINALRTHGKKTGVASLCVGGGMGIAMAIELV